MRLIDADTLTEEIKSLRCTLTGLRAGKGVLAHAVNEYRKSILQIIQDQPTAMGREKTSPVGGVDRSEQIDRISIENAVETPFWMAVWAAEPGRMIDVRMSYDDLKTLCDLIDKRKKRWLDSREYPAARKSRNIYYQCFRRGKGYSNICKMAERIQAL